MNSLDKTPRGTYPCTMGKNLVFLAPLVAIVLLSGCQTILKTSAQLKLPAKTAILTFDDGPNPHPSTTDALLDTLKRLKVKAVFSLIGEKIPHAPQLVKRMLEEGHLVAYHSLRHDGVSLGSKQDMEKDYLLFSKILQNYDLPPVQLYRPPMGLYSGSAAEWAKEEHLGIVWATYLPLDPHVNTKGAEGEKASIRTHLEKNGGGIVLLHDGVALLFSPQEKDFTDPEQSADRRWVPTKVEELVTELRAAGWNWADPHDYFLPK